MPEQTRVSEPAPSIPPQPIAPSREDKRNAERDRNLRSVIVLASFCIIGCFFLPWIRIVLVELSGYDIQKLSSDEAKLVWFIPATAGAAALSALLKQGTRGLAMLAGAVPYIAAIYYRQKLGEGFFQALRPAAYLTLVIAAILFVASLLLSKKEPEP